MVQLAKKDIVDKNIEPILTNPLKSLSKDNKISFQQILNNLLDGKENLELKSHIFKPKALAGLKSLSNYLKVLKYPTSAEVIDKFITTYLEYMISYKRLSRTEVIKAFTLTNRTDDNEQPFNSNLD